ncbi:MAG: UvrD-helicase domain-containing protein [Pyramidobacter sp.]|nr:UvrD-helicase domain-containing protein [Pyramidobacter sp.]
MTPEGFVRVIAGAGSGKTRALTHRCAFLINELGILPENILCVTFTNKAAGEMRARIRNLVGDNDTAFINTFHGFCVAVLREDSNAVQYPKSFIVLDNSDIDAMLRLIYEERGLTLRDKTFSDARDMIEIQKLFKKPYYADDLIAMPLDALRAKYDAAESVDDIIFYGYLYQEKKTFALDYNDLIIFVLRIFARDETIRLKWQSRLEYIMIDEFQDIDALQYELMEVLCAHHRNLFIVGDPDQTIYTWRGANVKYILDFDKQFENVHTVRMLKNYRSVPPVIAAANSLIAKNSRRIRKELIPVRAGGEPVRFCFAKNAADEAMAVVKRVRSLHDRGVPYRDIAVLYRAHHVTRSIEEAFIAEKLPYHIYSGVQFFDRAEIKDALSYLRMIDTQDDLAFRRVVNVPKRNMGRRRMDFLADYAESHGCTLWTALKETLDDEIFKGTKAAQFVALVESFSHRGGESVSEILSAVLDESGYERMLRTEGGQARLDNLAELKQAVHEYETSCGEEASVRDYLAHVALFSSADAGDPGDKVKLMTVHAAKGLEFPHVILCGMNEGVFPSHRVKDLAGMEEERRLAFVAMTRAKDSLYLTAAEGRNFDNTPRYPSRFVLDIGDGLIEYEGEVNETLIADARRWAAASTAYLPDDLGADAFTPQTRVRHPYFGEGTVLETDAEKGAYLIKFDAYTTPRRIAFRVRMEEI